MGSGAWLWTCWVAGPASWAVTVLLCWAWVPDCDRVVIIGSGARLWPYFGLSSLFYPLTLLLISAPLYPNQWSLRSNTREISLFSSQLDWYITPLHSTPRGYITEGPLLFPTTYIFEDTFNPNATLSLGKKSLFLCVRIWYISPSFHPVLCSCCPGPHSRQVSLSNSRGETALKGHWMPLSRNWIRGKKA